MTSIRCSSAELGGIWQVHLPLDPFEAIPGPVWSRFRAVTVNKAANDATRRYLQSALAFVSLHQRYF